MIGEGIVLNRTCLAADDDVAEPCAVLSRSLRHYAFHSLHGNFEVFGINGGLVLFLEARKGKPGFPDRLHQVRGIVKPTVSNDRRKVCHLQRYDQVLALANSDRIDVGKLPGAPAICAIIIRGAGYQSTFLVGKVYTQRAAESEAPYVLVPFCKSDARVFERI